MKQLEADPDILKQLKKEYLDLDSVTEVADRFSISEENARWYMDSVGLTQVMEQVYKDRKKKKGA